MSLLLEIRNEEKNQDQLKITLHTFAPYPSSHTIQSLRHKQDNAPEKLLSGKCSLGLISPIKLPLNSNDEALRGPEKQLEYISGNKKTKPGILIGESSEML